MHFPSIITLLAILMTSVLLASCGANKQQALLETVGSPQARPATFEAIHSDLAQAEEDQVNLISPEKYSAAKKSLDTAQTMQIQGQPADKINEKLSSARKDLDAAMDFAKLNRDALSPLLEARAITLNSGAAETTNKELKVLEDSYLDLVRDLQRKNSRQTALNKIPQLTHDYQNLSIKTLQAKYFGEAIANVNLAKSEGAEDLVPKTLKETEESIQKGKDFITQNQSASDTPKMVELGTAASMASRRLLTLTKQTKAQKGQSLEDISLKSEQDLKAANAARMEAQQKNADLSSKAQDYQRLEQKDKMNKKFEAVHELFDDSEAKIYRQGDSLVIRLKQMNFGVNQSEIPSPSYALLKKVQDAIRTFDKPNVIIEGHTDSTGDTALNKALSEQRAEAVKAYLLSNNTVPEEKITAVGYGSEKPLASNKLSTGRAINRRIDIVIKD